MFPCLEKQGGGKPKQIFNPFGPDNPHRDVGVFQLQRIFINVNIKKIIKEEMNDFDWVEEISSRLPKDRDWWIINDVDPYSLEVSEEIQDFVFKQGFTWMSGRKNFVPNKFVAISHRGGTYDQQLGRFGFYRPSDHSPSDIEKYEIGEDDLVYRWSEIIKPIKESDDMDWITSVSKDYWDYYDAVVFNKKLSEDEFNEFINQALKSTQPANASDWGDDDEMSDLEYLNYRIRREGQAFIGKYVDENGKTVLVYGLDPEELYPQVKDPKAINYEDIKKGLFESKDFSWVQDIEPPVFKQLDIATKDDNNINVKWGDNGDFSEVIDSTGHRYFNQSELGLFLGLSYRNWSETINNLGKSNLLLYIKHLIDSIEWNLPRDQEDYEDFIKLYKIVKKL